MWCLVLDDERGNAILGVLSGASAVDAELICTRTGGPCCPGGRGGGRCYRVHRV
jgi:hypothetical protein